MNCQHEWSYKTEMVVTDNPKFDHKNRFSFRVKTCIKCGRRLITDFKRENIDGSSDRNNNP